MWTDAISGCDFMLSWPSPAPPLSTWKITGHIPSTIDNTAANNIRFLGLLPEKDIIKMTFSCGSKEIGSKYCPELDAHEQKIAEGILRWMGMIHFLQTSSFVATNKYIHMIHNASSYSIDSSFLHLISFFSSVTYVTDWKKITNFSRQHKRFSIYLR